MRFIKIVTSRGYYWDLNFGVEEGKRQRGEREEETSRQNLWVFLILNGNILGGRNWSRRQRGMIPGKDPNSVRNKGGERHMNNAGYETMSLMMQGREVGRKSMQKEERIGLRQLQSNYG